MVTYKPDDKYVTVKTMVTTNGDIKIVPSWDDKNLVTDRVREKIYKDIKTEGERFTERHISIESSKQCLEFIADLIDSSTYGLPYTDQWVDEIKNIFLTTAKLLDIKKDDSDLEEKQRSAIKYLTDNLGLTASNKRPSISDEKIITLFRSTIEIMGTSQAYESVAKEIGVKPETVKKKVNSLSKINSLIDDYKSWSEQDWDWERKKHDIVDVGDKIIADYARETQRENLIFLREQIDKEIKNLE